MEYLHLSQTHPELGPKVEYRKQGEIGAGPSQDKCKLCTPVWTEIQARSPDLHVLKVFKVFLLSQHFKTHMS